MDDGGAPHALATVVRTKGSTYRRPGAMMLCRANGETIGTISGGCLESEVAAIAREVLKSAHPRLLAFDMRQRQGCNGLIEIFVEPLPPTLLRGIAQALSARRSIVAATVFELHGERKLLMGTRLLVDDTSQWQGAEADRTHFGRLWDASRETLENRKSGVITHHLGNGIATTFLRAIRPPLRIVIFGGSDDSLILAELAESLGWEVIIAIHPSTEPSNRLAKMRDLKICAPEAIAELVNWDSRTATILMTHHFGRDAAFLKALLPLEAGYLGLLGPRTRREDIVQTILNDAPDIQPAALTQLYGPAGLDLGAETPEQVALAILSEMQAVLNGRSGGSLRKLKTPIHVE